MLSVFVPIFTQNCMKSANPSNSSREKKNQGNWKAMLPDPCTLSTLSVNALVSIEWHRTLLRFGGQRRGQLVA